jgi:chemotaxis protein CheD
VNDADPVYVRPGEVVWSLRPCEFRTVLGSCVAVCLWDAGMRAGGVNHFLLPRGKAGENDARYGDVAIRRLLEGLCDAGCRDLVAKVFGGAAVMRGQAAMSVGEANLAVAEEMLGAASIPIVARRVGGRNGISLRFTIADGVVKVSSMRGYGGHDGAGLVRPRRPYGSTA